MLRSPTFNLVMPGHDGEVPMLLIATLFVLSKRPTMSMLIM